MTLLFILAIRELGSSLFLYSSGTMVMAVQLLGYYEGGNIGITAAFSLVQMVLLGVLITITNFLSRGSTPDCAGSAQVEEIQDASLTRRQSLRHFSLSSAWSPASAPPARRNRSIPDPALVAAANKEGAACALHRRR